MKKKTNLEKIKDYAFKCHANVNHKYDKKPYSVHLDMVYFFANQFINLIDKNYQEYVLCACYTHDVIEDCRETYNDVKKTCGYEIAEITYALSNEKGKTRKEIANKKYYKGIRKNDNFIFVKLCDRLANINYSMETKSNMLTKYRDEHKDFKRKLYKNKFKTMFELMELKLNYSENKYEKLRYKIVDMFSWI